MCMSYALNGDSRGWEINRMAEMRGWDGAKIANAGIVAFGLGTKEGFPSIVCKSWSQSTTLKIFL